jgi:predicted dehydrogenase
MAKRHKVRYAVVGLGWFAQTAVLPGFTNVKNAELAALVSGDADKRQELSKKYNVPAYPYEEYDRLLAAGTIDAVYIVLPNSMHCDYTLRAAAAHVAVLCEKPLAGTAEECRRMIDACNKAGVQLMTAYRLHLDPCNLAAVDHVLAGTVGEPRLFHGLNVQQVEADNTRLDADLDGHPLLDLGIYCVNAARYLFRDEPTEVSAFSATWDQARFRQVPEMVSCLMRFPKERLAAFTCGFGEGKVSEFRLVGTTGDLRAYPAFAFQGKLNLDVTTDGGTKTKTFPPKDQVGGEIAYFASCVRDGKFPEPDGDEGLRDLIVIDGLRESLRSGRPVSLPSLPPRPRPSGAQQMKVTKSSEPELVKAASPSGD